MTEGETVPPIRHNSEHPRRPEFWNGISLGNVLTIICCLAATAMSWGGMMANQKAQDDKIAAQSQEIAAVDQRREKGYDDVRADLSRVESKIDRVLLEVRDNR